MSAEQHEVQERHERRAGSHRDQEKGLLRPHASRTRNPPQRPHGATSSPVRNPCANGCDPHACPVEHVRE
jgi:hypothetical protein